MMIEEPVCLACLAAAAYGVIGTAWVGGMIVLAVGILGAGARLPARSVETGKEASLTVAQ
jgi:hypothetical protein